MRRYRAEARPQAVTFHVPLDPETHAAVRRHAQMRHMPMTTWVRLAIAHYATYGVFAPRGVSE